MDNNRRPINMMQRADSFALKRLLFAMLGYDNANRITSLGYSNGTSTSYTYDVASRLTNINHIGPAGIIEALTYQYDAAGNRTA